MKDPAGPMVREVSYQMIAQQLVFGETTRVWDAVRGIGVQIEPGLIYGFASMAGMAIHTCHTDRRGRNGGSTHAVAPNSRLDFTLTAASPRLTGAVGRCPRSAPV